MRRGRWGRVESTETLIISVSEAYILDVFKRLVVSHRLVWPPEYEISINIVRNTAKTSKNLEKTKNIKI
jgi:hypothetical protein